MVTFVRWIYLPLLLLVGNGLAIFLVSENASKISLIALVLSIVMLSFVFERIAPYSKSFNLAQNDTVRDSLHALVNEMLNIIGWLMLPLIAQILPVASIWPTELPLAIQLVLAILIADIGITLAHYASHIYAPLWRLHSVHHSVKRMYGFNGLMKHPLHQTIETFAGVFPLILLGVTQDVLALLIVAVVIQLLLQHSNINYIAGPFRYLLAINQIHRFHHLSSAKQGDVNFGLFTTLTDRILGTAYYDATREFSPRDLGIESEPSYPNGYIAQLIYPFKAKD